MEGGREGARRWKGERARALGKEGRREGEGGAGDVGQPGEQGGGCSHALCRHGQGSREEWVGVAGQLLDHLHFLPRRLLRLTVCVNLHHIQAVGFLIINLLKLARSADKVPSPSPVLLPISIPRPLPTFQPFHCHRLHSRTLATRYQSKRTMKGQNDRVTAKQVYVRLLLSCRLYSVNWGSVW